MHFLLEDSLLFPDLAAPNQAEAGGSLQLYDEADHKDDLVISAVALARVIPSEVQAAFFEPGNHKRLANSPVLPPPKA